MAARAGLWLAVGTAVLAACAPGPVSSPGSSPTADAARDAATVVDPDELVALAGCAGKGASR